MRTFLSIAGRGCIGLFVMGILTGSASAQYAYPPHQTYSTYSHPRTPFASVPYGYGPYDEASSCWWAAPDCGSWVPRCGGGAWQCIAPTIGWASSSMPYAYPYGTLPYGVPPPACGGGVFPNTTVQSVISTNAFYPQVLRIRKGMTVKWENQDSVAHSVTSTEGIFSSPALFKGETYSHMFRQAGVYYYRCQYHPAMWGVVVVSE